MKREVIVGVHKYGNSTIYSDWIFDLEMIDAYNLPPSQSTYGYRANICDLFAAIIQKCLGVRIANLKSGKAYKVVLEIKERRIRNPFFRRVYLKRSEISGDIDIYVNRDKNRLTFLSNKQENILQLKGLQGLHSLEVVCVQPTGHPYSIYDSSVYFDSVKKAQLQLAEKQS